MQKSENVLEVTNLVKNFGSFNAVKSVSFSVKRGQVIGLLGPNGAGKTTTIHMLLGVTKPTSGVVKYFNQEFPKQKTEILSRINFASAFNTLQGRITVWENLYVFAKLYSIENYKEKIEEVVNIFEIEDLLKSRFWDLSAGQKTRVNLAKALLNDPELILMDEPTASLDPDIADKTINLITKLKKDKKISMLYTSHDMDEVSRICDEVIFLDHGKIVAQDTPLGLTKRIKKATLQITFDAKKEKVEKFLKSQDLEHTFLQKYIVAINTKEELIPKTIFKLSEEGIWITDIEVKKPTLEDVFLEIARGGKNVA